MSKEIWTVIKYKPKDGCEEEFVDGLKRLGQIEGLEWLDSVDHLLEYYDDGSRTEAFSGFVIE